MNVNGFVEYCESSVCASDMCGSRFNVMFRKGRMGRRRGGVLLYIKETVPAYEVQLQEESDCNEAILC